VDELQQEVQKHVKVKKLDKLVCGMFTAWIESFHSQCNLGAPKQKCFPRTMKARLGFVELMWNKDKISKVFYENSEPGTPREKWLRERRFRASAVEEIFQSMLRDGRLFKKGDDEVEPVPIGSLSDDEVMESASEMPQRRSARLSGGFLSPDATTNAAVSSSSSSSSSLKRRRQS